MKTLNRQDFCQVELGRVYKLPCQIQIPLASGLKSARILGVALLPQNFEQDRGTLIEFSPLFKAGDESVSSLLQRAQRMRASGMKSGAGGISGFADTT
jgi:hypothetical protein